MDFTSRKARIAKIQEAEAKKSNPRIKSIRLTGSRLAIRIARQAKSSASTDELLKLSIAQSTISTAMSIVEEDHQRANRLIDMARSIANGNAPEEEQNNG